MGGHLLMQRNHFVFHGRSISTPLDDVITVYLYLYLYLITSQFKFLLIMCFWFEGSMQKKRDGKKCLVTDEADALGNVGLQISPPKSGLSSGWYAKARGSHVACLDLVTCKPGEKTAAWKKLSSWQLGNSVTQENVRLGTQESTFNREVVFASKSSLPEYFHWISFVSWQHGHLYNV